jgi:hypothetical protein
MDPCTLASPRNGAHPTTNGRNSPTFPGAPAHEHAPASRVVDSGGQLPQDAPELLERSLQPEQPAHP